MIRACRQAANLAIDRQGSNEALMLGHALVSGNPIVPTHYEFFWQPPPPVYDPRQARETLKEAGFPNGFDGGEYYCDSSYGTISDMVVDNLLAVGIRTRLRPIERAAFIKGLIEKKFKNLIEIGPAAFGNAATRIEAFASRTESLPMVPIRILTSCISRKPSNSIARSARRCCTKSSRS